MALIFYVNRILKKHNCCVQEILKIKLLISYLAVFVMSCDLIGSNNQKAPKVIVSFCTCTCLCHMIVVKNKLKKRK